MVAGLGQKVMIYFTSFDMGNDYCGSAYVKISEDLDRQGRIVLSKGCVRSPPTMVISSDRYLDLEFYASRYVNVRGFVAHYKVVNSSSGCDGNLQYIAMRFSQSNGSISSPNYPSSYGAEEDCNWRIKSLSYDSIQKLIIYFLSFDLGTDCCSCAYVEIFDGPSDYYKLLARFCGTILPPPVFSSGRYIYVKFHSNSSHSSVPGRGFKAHYKVLLERYFYPDCPRIDPKAFAGVIYNSGFPTKYVWGILCKWNITAPPGMVINLTFTEFDLRPSWESDFCRDYVEVADGKLYRRRFCRSLAPFSLYFEGSISVTFYPGGSGETGFLAFYQIRRGVVNTTSDSLGRFTPKPTFVTPVSLSDACKPYSQNRVDVGSSRSLFIVSPTHHGSSDIVTTCSWEISTTKGYILQLTIENMTISSCNASCCAYRYIQARDGIELSDPLLGTYCDGSHPGLVSTKGNQMFIKYYGRNSRDAFQATVHSKKADNTLRTVIIVVAIVAAVVGVVIVAVAVIVIKKRRSSARPSDANAIPPRSPSQRFELSPLYPPSPMTAQE